MAEIKKTVLHEKHIALGATMVDFGGWHMPLQYKTGIVEEHLATRKGAGLFDVSHMGRVKFSGRHARKLLERLCTRRIHDMQAGQCRYSLVCNDNGGVRDDVIVYRFDEDDFTVVVNGANRAKLVAHFEQVRAASELTVKIDDQTSDTAMVALQGPKVIDLIGRFSKEIPTLKRYRFTTKNLLVFKLIVSRTGYTGEDGVEVIAPARGTETLIKMLLAQAKTPEGLDIIKPIGLGARDTLRMEAAMPLYGHELGEEINALSCGVDFGIALDKDQGDKAEKFIGMDALKKTQAAGGPQRKLAGFFVEGKRSARQGMVIKHNGKEVGVVTSGCPSPTLGRCIAMGFLDKDLHAVGTKVEIDSGKGTMPAEVTTMPFYKAAK